MVMVLVSFSVASIYTVENSPLMMSVPITLDTRSAISGRILFGQSSVLPLIKMYHIMMQTGYNNAMRIGIFFGPLLGLEMA